MWGCCLYEALIDEPTSFYWQLLRSGEIRAFGPVGDFVSFLIKNFDFGLRHRYVEIGHTVVVTIPLYFLCMLSSRDVWAVLHGELSALDPQVRRTSTSSSSVFLTIWRVFAEIHGIVK